MDCTPGEGLLAHYYADYDQHGLHIMHPTQNDSYSKTMAGHTKNKEVVRHQQNRIRPFDEQTIFHFCMLMDALF